MHTILIIEDEKEYRDLLKKRLEHEGYTVITAQNGEEGLKILSDTSVELILLDLLMPGVDGNTFLYHIHSRKLATPIIILTNLEQAAVPDMTYEYVVKANTTLDELVEKVKNIFN